MSSVLLVECEMMVTKYEDCGHIKFDITEKRKSEIMYSEDDLRSIDEKCFLSCFLLGFQIVNI